MRKRLYVLAGCFALVALGSAVAGQQLPSGYVDSEVLSDLLEPATLAFAPDGRLFVGERITGRLLVAKRSADSWSLEPTPFFTFDIPKNPDGSPARHRSSGLRDIAFDPDFDSQPWIYAFYMQDNPRHNRVVRVQASAGDPDVADAASLEVLIDLPFNVSGSSGSHNGGGLEFGSDGMLYITTGDGWTGGAAVQSLETFTGKVLRIEPDGDIPTDNPYYGTAQDEYRAIFAQGLRNPFSISYDPETQNLFVNDAVGAAKANIYLLAAGANYGHQGGSNVTPYWANGAAAGELVTGGAWYPTSSVGLVHPFPSPVRGSYFMAFWGGNGSSTDGAVGRLRSFADPTAVEFATSVHSGGTKPILTRLDPLTGDLFYALTTYETEDGSVHRIRYTGEDVVDTPTFDPPAGQYEDPVSVSITTTTVGAVVRYTSDGSTPTETSPVASDPVSVSETTTLRARAFAAGCTPSAVAEAGYLIGPIENLPPVTIAGADQVVMVGQLVTLNGSASFDPDGDDEQLDEEWVQLSGPPLSFVGDDFVSFITPTTVDQYEFELRVSDGEDQTSDRVLVTALACVDDVIDGLIARFAFDEGEGSSALDSSAGARVGRLVGAGWTTDVPDGSLSALALDGVDDRVDLGSFDLGGTAFTISAWVKADDFGQMDGRLVSKASGEAESAHWWMLSTILESGEYRLRGRLRVGGSTSTLIASAGALQAGSWHHAALRYGGGALALYLDGAPVGSISLSGVVDTDPQVPVAVGDQAQGNRPLDGALDELRLYDRALSPDEILKLAGLVPDACSPVFADGFESGTLESWSASTP